MGEAKVAKPKRGFDVLRANEEDETSKMEHRNGVGEEGDPLEASLVEGSAERDEHCCDESSCKEDDNIEINHTQRGA